MVRFSERPPVRERKDELRINHQIRVREVRVINHEGKMLGVMPTSQALRLAQEIGLDLVEVAPSATPPVCKISDYGKLRYEKTKKEKEQKKGQHQIKVKEVKFKPTIDEHDFQFKLKHAREFLEKGNKVRIICTFRGREVLHPEGGKKAVQRMADELKDVAQEESNQFMGKVLTVTLAPFSKKKGKGTKSGKEEVKENKDAQD